MLVAISMAIVNGPNVHRFKPVSYIPVASSVKTPETEWVQDRTLISQIHCARHQSFKYLFCIVAVLFYFNIVPFS